MASERVSTKYGTNLGTLRAWSTIYELTPMKLEENLYSTTDFHSSCRSCDNCTLALADGKRSMGVFQFVPDPMTMKKCQFEEIMISRETFDLILSECSLNVSFCAHKFLMSV